MAKKILIGVGLVVVIFLVVVAMQPSEFRVTRSASMAASQSAVFAQVNDFHNWNAWSPWAKMDPQATNKHEGPPSGLGAMFSWAGNDKVGEGKMTIIEVQANELIRVKLDFIKPFASTATTLFTFTPEANGTLMSWTMTGHNSFMSKAFCMFMNMDKMVGADFEKGLASIKAIVEAQPKVEAPPSKAPASTKK